MGGMIVVFFIFILLLILGVILSLGKGAFLIAGYNTLSKEEKSKYNEKALCKFMGRSMLVIAFSVLLWWISSLTKQNVFFAIGLILFYGTIVFILVYSNTKNRFKK